MGEVGMVPYERIDVYNVDNANRFSTYLIEGPRGERDCCVNGAAARLVSIGDKLILASYTTVPVNAVKGHAPTVVLIGEDNQIKETKDNEKARVRVPHNNLA
jgi:aspartate 1-decarboxylase